MTRKVESGIELRNNGKFRVNVMLNGRRMSKVVDTIDQARELRDEYKSGKPLQAPISMSVGEAFKMYQSSRQRAKMAKGKEAKDSDLAWVGRHIVDFVGYDTQLNNITPALSAGLFDYLTETLSLKPSSVNEIGSCFYQMQDYAFKRGLMTSTPCKMDRLPESEGRYRYLTDAEEADCINWMRWNADYPSYTQFVFLLDTGCRIGEARALEWSDCDTDTGRITFWGNTTKTGKSRTVQMSNRLKEMLTQHQRMTNHPKVFDTVTSTGFYDTWKRMRQALGKLKDPQFVIHALRHTCATKLMAGGVDVVTVQHWLGHTDIKTTMKYAHFMPERLAVAADAINHRATHVSA